MKVVMTMLYAALAAIALPLASSNSLRVKVRLHHSTHEAHRPLEAPATTAKPTKNLYHVSGSKAVFDQVLRKNPHFDVWRIARVDGRGEELQADILSTAEAMEKLLHEPTKSQKGHHHKGSSPHHTVKLQLKQETTEGATLDSIVANDRKQVAACLDATAGYQLELGKTKYTDSAYFNCFRPYDQIFAFFDTLASQNPELMTKIVDVAKTYEGRSIHAYKLATKPKKNNAPPKKALYTQSLIHAREWQGGASTHFTVASLLDDLRAGEHATVKLFDEFDWYFVPLVNIDGYKYSWDVDRYWRVNRHAYETYEGVDLNRNFPPVAYFNKDPSDVSPETIPGPAPLSEPETRGIYDFVMGLPGLAGVMDVHAFAGMVLRPFSDIQGEPVEPYGSAMKQMGNAVRDAMSPEGAFQYVSQPSGALYPAYGCVDDGFYRMTNFTVPALTIEVEGDDFIAPQDSIRDVAHGVNHGLRQFALEASVYHTFVQKLNHQTKKH